MAESRSVANSFSIYPMHSVQKKTALGLSLNSENESMENQMNVLDIKNVAAIIQWTRS